MKKRLPALLLALTMILSLAACGGSARGTSASPSADPSAPAQSAEPSADPAEAIDVDLSEGIVNFSSGFHDGDALVTVGDTEVPAGLFLYWLFTNCYYFEANYAAYGDAFTVANYGDMLLDDTVNMALYYTILREKAAELGVPLTDEQLDEARQSFEGGELTYDQLKQLYGLDDDSMDYIATLNYYYTNVLGTIPQPTDEELNGYAFQVKHILLKTTDDSNAPLDDEAVAEKRAQAEDILAQLQALEGDAQREKFDELMNEFSEDPGLASNPDGYEYTTDDSLVDGFTEAALALQPGEISGIVETSYGYHIMLRGEVADLSTYAEAYRAHQLDDQMDQWAKESTAVRADGLSTLNVSDFYQRYMAYQQALMEQIAPELVNSASPAPESGSPAPEG